MYIPLEHHIDTVISFVAQASNSGQEFKDKWASPVAYGFYLGAIFVLMMVYYQWAWTRKVDRFVRVLVSKHDGSTDTEYAPKQGAYVALKQRDSATTRLWPINQLAAIEMLYPGDGFVPRFLQKKIKTVIVSEEDWEPLLNRGSYNELVASPDVIEKIKLLAGFLEEGQPDLAEELVAYADSLSSAPTRDMIASPAVLGNIVKEKVSEMVVAIASESLDKLDAIVRKLEKLPNSIVLYVLCGMAALFALIAMIKVLTMSGVDSHQMKSIEMGIQLIQQHLGISTTTVTTPPVTPIPGGQ